MTHGFRREKLPESGKENVYPINSFFDELCSRDKERMIKVTRLCHQEYNPGKPLLSIEECVRYIEMVGPEVWEREMKRAVDEDLI